MNMPTAQSIRESLASFPDPETGRGIQSMGQLVDVNVDNDDVRITLALATHSMPIVDEVKDAIASRLAATHPGIKVVIDVTQHSRPPARLGQVALRAKSVILVGSGKGGVGKSTVAACLALTLRRLGAKVGLMDADVYGPSIPHLLGLEGRPSIDENKKIQPILLDDDLPVMSMGFLIEKDQAVIWRGPMLHGSITQFLGDTNWGELDYLVIDMPPGTGDIALTLSQIVPVTGAVVVCTPQEVALLDAVKAVSMFRKVNIPMLGMVENMSGFLCPDSGKTYDIFGSGGTRDKAEELGIPFLGTLPIDMTLRIAGDEGRLAEVIAKDERARAPFDAIARGLVRGLASRNAEAPARPQLPTL